jgi:hypothetical protein
MIPRRTRLLRACDHKDVFGVQLWPKQRKILGAIDEGPRIHVLKLGRRSGKTFMAALVMLHNLLLREDLQGMVRPGERRYAVGIATNVRQARLLVAAARSIVEASPRLASMIENLTEDEIRFTNGTALAAFPCSSRGGRGWAISCLVMDEAAWFLSETEGFQTADEVWRALAPSTAQFREEGRVILASTPAGPLGLFYDLYSRAQAGEIPEAKAHHATTAEMNPTITSEYLATEQARDPESFRSEFLGEFDGGGSAFVDFDRITIPERDTEVSPEDLAPPVVLGCDAAFSGHDLFGICVVGRDPAERRRLVVAHIDGLRPRRVKSFEERSAVQRELLDHVGDVCKRYCALAAIDQYASAQVEHHLNVQGVRVVKLPMSAQSKTAAYVELRQQLYTGQLDIPADPELLGDLRRLRTKIAAGSSSVVVPRVAGNHGDRGQALAIACLQQARYGAMGEESSPVGGESLGKRLERGRMGGPVGNGRGIADVQF